MRKYPMVLILALVVMVSMCVTPPEDGGGTNTTGTYYIESSGPIPADVCSAKGLEGRVIVIHRTGCPACAVAVPILEELEAELGMDFEILDMIEPQNVERLQEIDVMPYYVPTTIVGCQAVVGIETKENYKSLIESL